MATMAWKLPVPSTALIDGGPKFEVLLRRVLALRMLYEADEGLREVTLFLEGVEAYRVTLYRARSDAMLVAYDRLISLGESDWLREVAQNLGTHGGDASGIAHLMINFDDGPCYEFICRTHRVEERAMQVQLGAMK